jgi:hypothetical protein
VPCLPDQAESLRKLFSPSIDSKVQSTLAPTLLTRVWGISYAQAKLYLGAVLADSQSGIDNGFGGIPAFIIGDVKLTGAQSIELFRKLVERTQRMTMPDSQVFSKVKLNL